MIKLDKIKLLTKSNYITDLNQNLVNPLIKPNAINQNKPFNLFIHIKPQNNESIIEFTSKILLDDYPKLISIYTIQQCLENIVKMGYCKLDIESVIYDSQVLSCDITEDIDEIILPDNFKPLLIANLTNVSKYNVEKYSNSGYTVSNKLKTKNLKIRLSIYNKFKEIQKATNKNFINRLKEPEKLINYFKGKYRIETNIKTVKQIKEFCGTEDNQLTSILFSNANPLLDLFDKIFVSNMNKSEHLVTENLSIFDYESINQLRDALLLKECGNDIKIINDVLNNYYSPKTNKRKYIKSYKTLLNNLPQLSKSKNMMEKIRTNLIT
jgi:hypothetical protein